MFGVENLESKVKGVWIVLNAARIKQMLWMLTNSSSLDRLDQRWIGLKHILGRDDVEELKEVSSRQLFV